MSRGERQVVSDVLWWTLRDAGISQASYAQAAGISLTTAARRLRGGRVFIVDVIAIADLVGIGWGELVERIERALSVVPRSDDRSQDPGTSTELRASVAKGVRSAGPPLGARERQITALLASRSTRGPLSRGGSDVVSAVLTERTLRLRPNLLADLEAASAADLAARIAWGDVEHLAAALDGEPTSLELVSHLVSHYLTVPFAYFATTA